MTWSSFKGLITGFAIVAILVSVVIQKVAADENKGLMDCTAHSSFPICIGQKIPASSLVGYSFAPGSHPKDGDALTCTLTQHNDWYFTWDRRGHGWHNDKTYSFDNCRVGRQA